MNNSQSYLILSCSSPYGGSQARAALDVALTAAAFEQDVKIVFMDEGVLQLLTDQDTETSGLKSVGKMIPALSLYAVNKVYVHKETLGIMGLNPDRLMNGVELIDNAELGNLMASSDQVMVFR
jgi:tRNA 2-thiouridine synthesizing protein C